MNTKYNAFYFTKEDPDYSLKGSRDPLGFQVLWQHQGRKLAPYLSTVSINLQDFQILCLAHYFYGKETDKKFASFFFRFEQLMAYVRVNTKRDLGFNGVDRVRKKVQETNKISISNTKEDEILSNQRAYGIWGKYSRPFREIGFATHKDFHSIFESKLNSLKELSYINKIIKKIIDSEKALFKLEDLKPLEELLVLTKLRIVEDNNMFIPLR